MVFTLLRDEKKNKKRKEKESVPMNKISRKGFLKIAAAAAMSGVTAGALAACNSASSSTASGAAGQYIPGTYEGTAEGISSTVKVTMTFSDSAVTDVVVDTSGETASFEKTSALAFKIATDPYDGCRFCRDRRRFRLYHHLRCRDEGCQELLRTGKG